MKLKFEIEIEVPEASEYAKLVYKHIYEDDYYEDSSLEAQLCDDIVHKLEDEWDIILTNQIPKDYYKQYNKTLNSLL
jgi:hypothetical protein